MDTTHLSAKIKERFCKDCNIPIKLYQEPYFSHRLSLYDYVYDTISKWKRFTESIQNFAYEQDYFEHYNLVKDNAINDIKAADAYQRFNKEDMQQFAVTHKGLPSKDIFHASNNGRTFISIDMKKANFTSLRHYDKNIFKCAATWEDFISQYTDNPHIQNSKYIRQIILGNCNPKQHITYEKFLMDAVLTEITDPSLASILPIENIVSFSNDEIIINISKYDIAKQLEIYHQIQTVADYVTIHEKPIALKVEYFILHAIGGTNGYYKELCDGTIEFKCLDNYNIPFVIRALKNEPVQPSDTIFYHEGLLSQFIDVPDIVIPHRQFK